MLLTFWLIYCFKLFINKTKFLSSLKQKLFLAKNLKLQTFTVKKQLLPKISLDDNDRNNQNNNSPMLSPFCPIILQTCIVSQSLSDTANDIVVPMPLNCCQFVVYLLHRHHLYWRRFRLSNWRSFYFQYIVQLSLNCQTLVYMHRQLWLVKRFPDINPATQKRDKQLIKSKIIL